MDVSESERGERKKKEILQKIEIWNGQKEEREKLGKELNKIKMEIEISVPTPYMFTLIRNRNIAFYGREVMESEPLDWDHLRGIIMMIGESKPIDFSVGA